MATTITVPSGTGHTSVTLTYATSASASLATSLLASVYAAAAGGTLSTANEFVVTTSGSYTVPSGVQTVVDASTGAVTITGNGLENVTVAAGSGSLDYVPVGGSGTVIAGDGANSFIGSGYALLGDAYTTGLLSGSTTVTAGGDLLSGPSPSVTAVGTGAFVLGSGPLSSDTITNDGSGPNTFLINAGATTVNAISAGGLYYDLSGTLTFANGGASTVVGTAGAGASTLFGGNSALTYMQGGDTAPVLFVGGAASDTLVSGSAGGITAFGGAGGALNLSGGASSAFNYLVGGTGAETLNAAFSSGSALVVGGSGADLVYLSNASGDVFFGGAGSNTIVGGTTPSGSGTTDLPDLYAFSNGGSGGTDTILNFGTNSGLVFSGYGSAGDAAIKAAIAAAGTGPTVSFTLPDNTKITLIGVNGSTVNPTHNPTFYS